ncbi:MAG: helix-turn-helix transcriptional regulator [Thermoleophilia bacterium]
MPTSGSIIREARLRARLTQGQLGELTGRDRAQIARWERDAVAPSFETMRELVRACGYDLDVTLRTFDRSGEEAIERRLSLTAKERIELMLAERAEGRR